jgi:hypothetical protein
MHNLRLILIILLVSFGGVVKTIDSAVFEKEKDKSISKEKLGIAYEEVKKMSDYQGWSDFEEYSVVYIKGDKERKDTVVIPKGLFQTLFLDTESQRTSRIIRLDKGLIWDKISLEKSTYTELTFAQISTVLKEVKEKTQEKEEIAEGELKTSLQKIHLYKSGKKKEIDNFPCEQLVLEAIKILDNHENKQRVIRHIVSKVWMTKETQILSQIREFDEQFLEKLGEVPTQIINKWVISTFFSEFQREMTGKIEKEIVRNIPQMEGYYPILSTMVIKIGTTSLSSKINIKFLKKKGFEILKDRREQIKFIEAVKMSREVKNFQMVSLEDEIFELPEEVKFKEEAEKGG